MLNPTDLEIGNAAIAAHVAGCMMILVHHTLAMSPCVTLILMFFAHVPNNHPVLRPTITAFSFVSPLICLRQLVKQPSDWRFMSSSKKWDCIVCILDTLSHFPFSMKRLVFCFVVGHAKRSAKGRPSLATMYCRPAWAFHPVQGERRGAFGINSSLSAPST